MELLKQEKPLEFVHKGVKFFIKPHASEHDRFMALMVGDMKADGSVIMRRSDFNETILRSFILGWEGVTENGKPISYSWEKFVMGWPKESGAGVFVELTNFILEKTDYSKSNEEIKKD